jgi:DNA-binding transcriptional regulator GbsR (MarR family)
VTQVAVLKPRERLVYFRVSEDEFRQFVSVCEQAGARSVSDLARSAVQRLISDGNRQREDDELTNKMYRLERLIAQVTEQLQLLSNQTNGEELDGFAEGAPLTMRANSPKLNGREGE